MVIALTDGTSLKETTHVVTVTIADSSGETVVTDISFPGDGTAVVCFGKAGSGDFQNWNDVGETIITIHGN